MKQLLLNCSVQLWQKEPNYSTSKRARSVRLRNDTVCTGRVSGCSEPIINRCQVLKFTPKGTKPTRALRFYIWSGGLFMDWLQNMQSLKKLGITYMWVFSKSECKSYCSGKRKSQEALLKQLSLGYSAF